MAAIKQLLDQIPDEALRRRLAQEFDNLNKQKKFGLVYEEHLPECALLYDVPIRRGTVVARRDGKASDLFRVLSVTDGVAQCEHEGDNERTYLPVSDLVAAAHFGEPVYPYLKPVDSICRAPENSLWHSLIEADNFHALQLLDYLYRGKVDCIYIDPPYNTGARDWKYNNDYVDSADQYRHSKWLSMMEKRLRLAKRLLNPKDSVLIVTIDEKEYLHLGCLLEELFPEARIQMISSVISPRGAMRKDMFTRVEEYIFYVFIGSAAISPFGPDMLQNTNYEMVDVKVWAQMIRCSSNGPRSKRPNLFYPVFFDIHTGKYKGVGDALPLKMPREQVVIPQGCFAVFPIRRDGLEVTWALQTETFKEKINKGYIKFGKWKPGDRNRAMSHLQSGTIKRIQDGEIEILGRDEEGTVILGNTAKPKRPSSVWNMPSHDAGSKGKNILTALIPNTDFAYPKSLYAVKDTLRFFVANKPNSLIVDFFAGSGTTLHAINLLNMEDGGHRRCIMVTNNEVSDVEAKSLTKQGYNPGDEEWEKLGIARHVAWPRTVCSIKGENVNGEPLKGNYLGSEIPMQDGFEANVEYFKLGFLDKNAVAMGRQFRELLPLLWLKAGAKGKRPQIAADETIPRMLVLPENGFAVLTDCGWFDEFKEAVEEAGDAIKMVFIVTDSENGFLEMTNELPGTAAYQLYRDFLDNFRINFDRQ